MEQRIYLRALEPEDYLNSVKWRNDEEIQNMVGGPKYFISSEREKEWVAKTILDNDKMVLAICLKENDKYIGNIMLQEIDLINRSAHMPILLGDKTEWNKGYATEARMMFLKFVFEERGMERIFAYVLEENISSIKMCEKCGYKVEGVLRKSIFKKGKFFNQVILSVLKEEFEVAYMSFCKNLETNK